MKYAKEDNVISIKYFMCTLPMALAFPVVGFSDELSREKEQLFQEFDTNRDNVISVDEADRNAWLFRQFPKIDKNHDEKLERSEFSAYEPEDRFQPPHLENPGVGAAPLDE